jgi:hypothetical protein
MKLGIAIAKSATLYGSQAKIAKDVLRRHGVLYSDHRVGRRSTISVLKSNESDLRYALSTVGCEGALR